MSTNLSASLLRLKLIDALRSGDDSKIDSIIAEIRSIPATVENSDLLKLNDTILHYAVQVAPLPTTQRLVERKDLNFDINAQDVDGNTPLHLAAAASRLNVVKYLLSLPDINDTLVNADKRQPVELAKDANIAQLMQFERAKFVERSATQLRHFFSNRDFNNLENLLVNNPRAADLLDINGADPETGNTVLHEFISKEDYEMCDWILKHGGDPFKRDKRGKLPIDLVSSRNDPIRKLLKSASKDQHIVDPVVNTNNAMKNGTAPTYRGYLRKWTNFASGYKLRYFVLDQSGILSYYADQGDTNNACRGSLNLGFASLHLDSSEKLKFEILGKNGIKWHLKANHPVETNRWVWTLQNAMTIAKDNLRLKRGGAADNREETLRRSMDESSPGVVEEEKKKRHLHIPGRRKHKRETSQVSMSSFTNSDTEDTNSTFSPTEHRVSSPIQQHASQMAQIDEKRPLPRASIDGARSTQTAEDFDYDLDESNESDDTESTDGNDGTSPGEFGKASNDNMLATRKSLQIEILSLLELYKALQNSIDDEPYTVGLRTLNNIHNLVEQLNALVEGREKKLLKKIERQEEVNRLWESSIRQLELEVQKRERTLSQFEGKKYQIRKLLAANGISSPQISNEQVSGTISSKNDQTGYFSQSGSNQGRSAEDTELLEEIFHDSDDEFFDADEFDETNDTQSFEGQRAPQEDQSIAATKTPEASGVTHPPTESGNLSEAGAVGAAGLGAAGAGVAGADMASQQGTEEQAREGPMAEQFQAEQSPDVGSDPTSQQATNATGREVSGSKDAANEVQDEVDKMLQEEGSYLGYERPFRTRLAYDEDNRPKVSLWGTLKSMIGRDMTKISLPVSFNECTCLLQRLAEDIEYNDLLSKAAGFDDSTLRAVYVTAFAASEYSSTIDRIAKPFNPLLGETFEYARPDQNFRLISEQVSHHPVISACKAQSPKWDYYGENAVDSQFRGRSFDFKHLGKMFCVIRPDNGVINSKGERVTEELYSWKKVNTSVVGIIVGNPKVDNYGKMEVTNHTTGDVVIVDLKQRGWKASSAYQLSGYAKDRKGQTHWAIGGRWNSKIFAKKSNGDAGESLIDAPEGKVSGDPYSGNKFLVWQVAPRPKVPFNLTSFALTLNDINDNLKQWLAPTDTRLRPDQRLMEDGHFDEAAAEKHRVEEKQRAARRQREQNREQYKPKWFVKRTHPVTGDAFWECNDQYWKMRRDHKLGDAGDIF